MAANNLHNVGGRDQALEFLTEEERTLMERLYNIRTPSGLIDPEYFRVELDALVRRLTVLRVDMAASIDEANSRGESEALAGTLGELRATYYRAVACLRRLAVELGDLASDALERGELPAIWWRFRGLRCWAEDNLREAQEFRLFPGP